MIGFGCEVYMSIRIKPIGSITYHERSAIKYEDHKDSKIISLKYNYDNKFNSIIKYDNTYSVVGILSSYDESNIKIFEHIFKYVNNTTNVGEDTEISLSLNDIDIRYQDLVDKLAEQNLRTGTLIVYYQLDITASSSKLTDKIILDNKDNITIKIDENGYTINDKNASTNSNMTIKDTSDLVEIDFKHVVIGLVLLVGFILMIIHIIKYVKNHNKIVNSFNNKIKRVTKGYEDRITHKDEMKYPKKVTYVEVSNFEELVKISKKAKDNIMEYIISENEIMYAVRLEDEVYTYKITKEE